MFKTELKGFHSLYLVSVYGISITGHLRTLDSCLLPQTVPRLYSYCRVWSAHISCLDIYSSLLTCFLHPSPFFLPSGYFLCCCRIVISKEANCFCLFLPRTSQVALVVKKVKLSHSVVSDSATLWTVAHQAPRSMGFSRQEYWIGLNPSYKLLLSGTRKSKFFKSFILSKPSGSSLVW